MTPGRAARLPSPAVSAHRQGPPLLGAVAGAVIGILVATALVVSGALRIPPADDPEAPGRFLVAWQRYRMATFTVEAEVRRHRSDGADLLSFRREVQQPPNRIVQEHGSASGRLDGKAVNCSLAADGSQICGATGASVPAWEDEVARELAVLRGYVAGDERLYDVTQDGWCFELDLVRAYPDPPYGEVARFCFDETTGALAGLDRRLDGDISETMQADVVTATVNPLDLTLTVDAATQPNVVDEPIPDVDGTGGSPGTTAVELTEEESLAAELAALDDDAFFTRARDAVAPAEFRAVVTESMRRLEAGTLSINDPRWLDARGQPLTSAPPVIRAMLEAGYHAPVPED